MASGYWDQWQTDPYWSYQYWGNYDRGAHGEAELQPGPGLEAGSQQAEAAEEPKAPEAAQQTPSFATNVALGAEVAEKLRSLNSGHSLQAPVDVAAVVGPLSQLDSDIALEILESLHERCYQVDDPTAWICEAAEAIPQGQDSWADPEEPEEPEEPKVPEDAKDVKEPEKEEVDPELLGLERPSKVRRTDSSPRSPPEAEEGEEAAEPGAAEEETAEAETEQPHWPGQPEWHEQPEWPGQPEWRKHPEEPPEESAPAESLWPGKAAGKGWSYPPAAMMNGLYNSRYKTDLCRRFANGGYCPSGPSCRFAHGPEELRPAPPPRIPPPFRPSGLRPYLQPDGLKAHVVYPPSSYRTLPCPYFPGGQCTAGEECKFAHSEQQLRLARIQASYRLGFPEEEPTSLEAGKELTLDQICNYKTRLCIKHEMGQCKLGENCLQAHGPSELQSPWRVPADDDIAEVEEASVEEGPAEEAPAEPTVEPAAWGTTTRVVAQGFAQSFVTVVPHGFNEAAYQE